jgi:hypothetical protein
MGKAITYSARTLLASANKAQVVSGDLADELSGLQVKLLLSFVGMVEE